MEINRIFLGQNPYHQDRKLYHKITKVIVHHTAGNDAGCISIGNGARYNVSFHFSIQKSGEIIQYVEEDQIAYHCGGGEKYFEYTDTNWGVNNLNPVSIGIEIVNFGDNIDQYTDAQRKSLIELTQYLTQKYNITSDNIIGHKELTRNKIDPTPSFFEGDMDGFRKYIKETYVEKYPTLGKVEIFNGFDNEKISGGEARELIEIALFRLIEDIKNKDLKYRTNDKNTN